MFLPFLLAAAVPSLKMLMEPLLQVLGEHWVAVVGIASLAIMGVVFKLPRVKGMIGEALVRRSLSRLDSESYRILHNVFVPSPSGEGAMTEIDHLVVSANGIFVVETKHYSGWIYGRPGDSKWTRTNFHQKHSFLNPLKQNQGHVNALAYFLSLPRSVFHPIVCFTGDATLKTPLPANVITSGLRRHIQSHQETLLENHEVAQVWERLKCHDDGIHKPTVRRQHVARLTALARR